VLSLVSLSCRKATAKLQPFFELTKFLSNFFRFFSKTSFQSLSLNHRSTSLEKRLQKYCFFLYQPNIFESFFELFFNTLIIRALFFQLFLVYASFYGTNSGSYRHLAPFFTSFALK